MLWIKTKCRSPLTGQGLIDYTSTMPLFTATTSRPARFFRLIAAMLLGAVLRRQSVDALEARLGNLPAPQQTTAVALVLGLYFLLSLAFAHLGLFGVLGFWMTTVVLVR